MTTADRRYDDWHWWCAQGGGRSAAQKEFEKLPLPIRAELLAIMRRWLTQTHARTEYDYIGRDLHEIRTREGSNHFRVLFKIEGRICVALTAFYKNQQQLPKIDGDRARKRMRSGTSVPMA